MQQKEENAINSLIYQVSLYCIIHNCYILTMRIKKKIDKRIDKLRR